MTSSPIYPRRGFLSSGFVVALATLVLCWQVARVRADDADGSGSQQRLLSGTRQVTFEGRRAGEGYFSADGTRLVFQSEREPGNPFYQIYLMDLDTGDVERVSPGHGKTTCAWIHPGGDKVLFASTHSDPASRRKQKEEIDLRASAKERRYSWDYDEHYDLWERDLKSGELRNLTNVRGYDAEGSWSPDGTLVAFASNRLAYTETLSEEDAKRFEIDPAFLMDIYVMNADGSNVRRLTTTKGYDGGPFFSPDGKRICWRRFAPDGHTAEVFTMNVDGSDPRQLTRIGAMSWAPFYHPSGEYLIFTTNRHGFANFELYLVDVRGEREPVRVTDIPGFDGLPVFSPDGRQLFWTADRTSNKKGQIFAAAWNHAAASELIAKSRRVAAKPAPADRAEKSTAALDSAVRAETAARVDAGDLRVHVAALASEELEGRMTGSPGERLATAYVARWFERIGLEPAGDDGSWYQEFPFTAGVALGAGNALRIDGVPTAAAIDRDFRPLAFSHSGSVEAAPIVFAGYGIVAPRSGEAADLAAYDSYVHLDVKGKWVLALRFLPEDVEPERRQHLARYSSLRYKAMVARDKGARGLIVVSGPRSKVKRQLVDLEFGASTAGMSLPAVSISDALADALLAPSKRALAALQAGLDSGEPQMGFALAKVELAATIAIDKVLRRGRNVLGRLRASDGAARRPVVVLGAHVDHLGRGASNSLARDDEKGGIHYGADDNASGVAAVIEIAQYLAGLRAKGKLPLERDIVFAAWSGEEIGLLGSQHFVRDLATELGPQRGLRERVAACLNLDMVGRLRQSLVLHGVGSSSIWRREIERRNAPVGLSLTLSDDPYLPTDATSFYVAGVPILSAFTGAHAEYHSPRDTPDRLDYDGMARIGRFFALLTRSLAVAADAPDYVQRKAPTKGPGRGHRVYLGTIPDYAEAPVPGLRLTGVAKGGPAEKAGLKAGDIVVEMAGRKVENIHDYSHALDALKVGQAAKVIVVRDGERKTFEVVPGSRG